ncbi:TQXA domain-containing protein [Kitasatospora herbaricolor]|nr:TQXA domain-containing protein [Kitasatospora herbaricolor]
MFHRQGRILPRIATVMLTSTLVAGGSLLGAGAASAADGPGAGVSATLQEKMVSGQITIQGEGKVAGGLFTLKTADGELLQTYCIDFGHGVDTTAKVQYQEADWKSSSLGAKGKTDAAAKIRWILENSYPHVKDLGALAKTAGITGEFTEQDAAAGTQAAIWHFSDGKKATPDDPQGAALTAYLLSDKNKGIAAEPKPSLSLTPESVAGKSGGKLGPFTVNSSADEVKLSVSGGPATVAVVDKDGKPLASLKGPIAKDTQFFLDVPAGTADGSASVTAAVSTVVPSGRVFLSKGYTADKHSQTMILAGSEKVNVSDTAKAKWTQEKGPLLAATSKVDCVENGVEVTVTNTGDQPAAVTVQPGKALTVQPGKAEKITVPVAEDTAYDIKVTGPNGFAQQFQGVLDCKVAVPTPSASPSPATSGSATPTAGTTPSTGTSTSPAATTGGGLAATGGSSATPVLAGVAGALVLAGGAAVFVLRRRGRHSGDAA